MPKVTVDGRVLDVPHGRTVIQALDDAGLLMNGVDVPHYCWHSKLSVDGSCRLSQVEIEGEPKLQIASNHSSAGRAHSRASELAVPH